MAGTAQNLSGSRVIIRDLQAATQRAEFPFLMPAYLLIRHNRIESVIRHFYSDRYFRTLRQR